MDTTEAYEGKPKRATTRRAHLKDYVQTTVRLHLWIHNHRMTQELVTAIWKFFITIINLLAICEINCEVYYVNV